MGKVYKNAPLKEAIFEIRFPADLSIECKRADFYNRIKVDFPHIFVPIVDPAEAVALKPYDFKSADLKKMIRFSINRFSFHAMDYSGGFELFEEECLKYINLFLDYFKISSLNRTGLRYINQIPIIRKNGTIPIREYLNFGFKLPETISVEPELFHTVLVSRVSDGKLRILVQYQQVERNNEVIVLDFDYYYEGTFPASNFHQFLTSSHKHIKEQVFMNLISDNYKKILEKE